MITIWVLRGYYYLCIESYAALVLVISICGLQPQGDSLSLLRCSIFEIIDCFWVNNLLDSVQQSIIIQFSYNFGFYKETRLYWRGKITGTKRYLFYLSIVFELITRVHQQFLWFNNEVFNTLKEWVQIPKMYSVSRPCSEEVITLFFQDRISGALPDWATIPT